LEPQEDNAAKKEKAKYLWDPVKLAWVESTETPTKRAEVEPAKEVVAESELAEHTLEDEVPATRFAIEAEAVGEALEYKGVPIRVGAAFIDFIILSIISLILRYTVGQAVSLPTWVLPVYGLVYFVAFWSWRGQTPGKMLIGARVVRMNGMNVGIERAFLRYIFYLMPLFTPLVFLGSSVSFWFFFVLPIIGIVVMALTRQRRGLHDLIAGTCVINTRPIMSQPEEVESVEPEEPDQSGSDTPMED